jgi:exodeoxyribonuclease VII large subunit
MSRKAKSQWDFGELFPPQEVQKVISVSELTAKIRRLMEKEMGQVWVTGEVTNLRVQSSGHIYFVLKDAGAQLSCVLFRGESVSNRELLQDGRKVVLQGDITVYEARGQYQLIVRLIDMQGFGALQAAFERLKLKLQGEGLFAPEHKRPIPRYPHRLGLVTSPTGAAIRDVLHVIQRRHAGLEIILASCRVQGQGAAEEIACAIELLNTWSAAHPSNKLDVILVTRGGGSLEDLWAFNEERLAWAIFESQTPVVSAVGHEIDFTISDFVADLRAATPSAAAELLTEGFVASRAFVGESYEKLGRLLRHGLEHAQEDTTALTQRLMRVHPRRLVNEKIQYLDDLQTILLRHLKQGCRERHQNCNNIEQRLWRTKPSLVLKQRQQSLEESNRALMKTAKQVLVDRQNKLRNLEARLRLLSPENVLARGYSITQDATSGQIIRASNAVKSGQELKTRVKTGEIRSKVK